FSARADLVGGTLDPGARARWHAGEVAGHPRAAGRIARVDRDALAVCGTAGLPGGAGHAVARLREAAGDAGAVDAGLSLGTMHAGASVDDRDAARAAGGAGRAGHRRAGQAGIRLTGTREADLAGWALGRADAGCAAVSRSRAAVEGSRDD